MAQIEQLKFDMRKGGTPKKNSQPHRGEMKGGCGESGDLGGGNGLIDVVVTGAFLCVFVRVNQVYWLQGKGTGSTYPRRRNKDVAQLR